MYYEFPRLDAAYGSNKYGEFPQYFFGDDMIVSPIVQPAFANTSFLAAKKWWIPPSSWIEQESGQMLVGASDGSTFADRKYDLGEVPILVKAGALIPTRQIHTGDSIGVASRQFDELIFTLYPGA